MNIDPLAEKGPEYSPYSFCFNNPMHFTDPDGRWPFPSWASVKSSYREAKATVSRTYNETKSTVSRSYNQAKTSIVRAKDNVVKSTEKAITDTRQYVKEHKKDILETAQVMQNVGDGFAVAGYAATATVVGAEVGIPMAVVGNGMSAIGSIIEIAVKLNDYDPKDNESIPIVSTVAGFVVEKGLNKVLPGAGKKIGEEGFEIATEILTQGAGAKIMATERLYTKKVEAENK
jgi:hypothetical protein